MYRLMEVFKSIQKHKEIFENHVRTKSEYYYNKYKETSNREKDNFSSTYYYTSNELKQIDIDIMQGEIELTTGDIKNVKISLNAVTFQNKDEWPNAEEYFFKESIFDIQNEILEVKIPSIYIWAKLKIEVPKKQYQNISVAIKHGNVKMRNIKCDYFFGKTMNGSFAIKKLHAKLCDLITSNGNVDFEEVQINSVKVNTTNGDINYVGRSQAIKAETVNGLVNIDNEAIELLNLSAYTINGSISVKVQKKLDFSLNAQTKNGQIKHDLTNKMLKKIAQKPLENEIEARVSERSASMLYLETKNGNIKIFRKENQCLELQNQ